MAATFARRRGVSEDEIKLVDEEEEPEEGEGGDDQPITIVAKEAANASDLPSGIEEEKHNVPFPLSFKQRVRRLKSRRSRRLSWWITVLVLGILAILAVSVSLGLWSNLPKESCLDFEDVPEEEYEDFPYLYFPRTGEIDLCHKGDTKLSGRLGVHHALVDTRKVDLYDYSYSTVLKISRPSGDNYNCLRIEWTGTSSSDAPLLDCYKMEDSLWYGGYESYNQMWPINGEQRPMTPFLPHDYLKDNVSHPELFGPILHPIWVSSNGTGILVDAGVPLHVSIGSDDEICLQALPYELECIPHSSKETFLKYTVCVYENIQDMFSYFIKQIDRQTTPPDNTVLLDPIWSTWAEFKANINSDTLNTFYNNITSYGFNISQLEIDDGYSKEYGELSFDEAKFVKADILSLSQKVPLTVWVHPFVNPHADEFMKFLDSMSYFLPGGEEGNSVSLVKWWHEYGAVIDFLNDTIAGRHQERLETFRKEYNLTSFKFDAGEVTYLPDCIHVPSVDPFATFSSKYASFVANQSYASRAEVRVGYFTQKLPILVRILDRDSTWCSANGLRSVIPTVLSLGIAGYSFVLPDMIGGNGLATDISEELYVRWVQLNAFLPIMQFSVAPWHYSSDTITHVRSMTQLHREMVPLMLRETFLPIVKPLWLVSGDIEGESRDFWETYAKEEFVIGVGSERTLVAPVLEENPTIANRGGCETTETPRMVYFPKGIQWKREEIVYNGGTTSLLCVGLYETLYFRIV